MSQGVTKSALESLAQAKFNDALLLFNSGRWANAFYLAGYAVELGLKACIAKQILPEAIPDRRFINSVYTHEYMKLIGLAGLTADLRVRQDADSVFAANWGIVGEWTPEARYESTDKSTAHLLLSAISDANHGVLPWIKTYW